MHLPVGVLPVLYEDNFKYGLGRLYSFVFLNDLVILPNSSISRSIISAPNKNITNNTVIEPIMTQYNICCKKSIKILNTILLPLLQKEQMRKQYCLSNSIQHVLFCFLVYVLVIFSLHLSY